MRRHIAVVLMFVAFTVVVTYPQARGFATSVPFHSDPYFSMWRLGWVAHTIVQAPGQLFEANIFHPEHDTLGYSDAMLLPGVVLAPLFWIGINPIVIYNGALFAAFVLSGFSMFLLARSLTGSTPASIVAGVIYAFAPSRFGHYVHLELQMVFWIPLALLLIHRILINGRLRDGALLAATVACQAFSSVYTAVFLVTYCAVLVPSLLIATGIRQARRLVMPILAGAVLAGVLVWPYGLAYHRAEQHVGTRSIEDVRRYSASFTNYLSAPAMSRLYGRSAITDVIYADEMNLFPGILAPILALIGVVAGKGRTRFAYLAALLFAIDMSGGANGVVYLQLFEHISVFKALRSAARFYILINLSLAVLSAYGVTFLIARVERDAWKRVMGIAIVALLILEGASAPAIEPAPGPSNIDNLLAKLPPTIIVELPIALPQHPGDTRDWLYMYQGSPHFNRMLNGYSGYAPESYYRMRERMATFPDDNSIAFLRERHVEYVVVRAGLIRPHERTVLMEQIQKQGDLSLVVAWPQGPVGPEALYALTHR